MPRSLRRVSLALVALSALSLAACGDDKGGGGLSTVSDGKLTACSDTPYEPFEFKSGDKDTGYDVDLLRAVAQNGKLELVVKDLPFDGILGSLAAGDCDVVASAVTITAERAKQVDFSKPYFDADQSLLVKADQAGALSSLDKLAGKTIGVQSGTTGETYAKAHTPAGASIKGFEDADGLFAAIESGDIAAILQDLPVNAYRATKDDTVKVVETYTTGEQYGFAVEKDNADMLKFIDDGLTALHDDGTFDTIYAKYFGSAK
jgi:polar amino acid transport system substrate-binding protein